MILLRSHAIKSWGEAGEDLSKKRDAIVATKGERGVKRLRKKQHAFDF